MSKPYVPGRDGRFEYAQDTLAFIERTNCAKGCTVPTEASKQEFGPGGDCSILARLFWQQEPIPELDDHGRYITCLVRQPPPKIEAEPEPVAQAGPDLFEATA